MNKKFGVCLLNDAFPPAIDGVGNVVFNYANEFNKRDMDVVVSTPVYPDSMDAYGYDVLRYPSINTIEQIGYTTGMPFDLAYINELKKRNIDIIHVHCPMTSMFLSRVLRDSIKKPIVFTYHTKYDIDIKRAIKDEYLQKKATEAIVSNISACDEVWAVSDGAADNLRSLGYTGDIRIMVNGVDMPKGKSDLEDIRKIREEYGLKDGVPAYLFVGRMMWYKGVRITLDALKKLKDSGKDFKMVFVGSGLELNEMKEYCTELGLDDKVLFAGAVKDRNKLKQIFSSFDAFIFPSTFDTNGLVVREAASSGLASILVKGSCAAENTADKRNCFWIEENSNSLYELLANTDIETFKKAGEKAMDELYLSWSDAVEKAYERYKEIIENYEYSERESLTDDVLNHISDLAEKYADVHEFVVTRQNHIHSRKEELKEDLHELRENFAEDLEKLKKDIFDR